MDPTLVIRSSLLKTFPEIIFCPTCKKVLHKPTTNFCGHTRCASCTRAGPCICGFSSNKPLESNKAIENILKEIMKYREKWTYKMHISRPKKIGIYRAVAEDGNSMRRSKYVMKLNINQINVCIIPTREPDLTKFAEYVNRADIECPICKETFTTPITTPCGHMFCKLCIECHLFYNSTCPLCVAPLNRFNTDETCQTKYMGIVLSFMGCYKDPPAHKEYLLPLVKIGSGYPEVLCAVVFSPNAQKFLYNLLNSTKPVFGIYGDCRRGVNDFGTVIEIRDCLQLPNGSFYVTGIGVRRFKVLGRYRHDRYTLARVVNIYDTLDEDRSFHEIEHLARSVISLAHNWLSLMKPEMRRRVELIFGTPTLEQIDIRYRFNRNGPNWLWRLINILPIKKCLLYLLLGETSLFLRMSVVRQLTKLAILMELQRYNMSQTI
ncbi:LON peptidase N-terminal domain and RING finger protein 1-like [Zerene cesonia]|uniref:LON peptidase N-terminal domain and RING finger protein 1-like n=1 Tax=Zerene cesonia TaxID=33412 RepID=UPI0018E50289|nr:LON peptidase N-terminal domain and RING finger protein 1-like [Zerene cesonia]